MSVRFLQLTFEPLVNSSSVWQRGRDFENNNIPANGTEIDSWVVERNLLTFLWRRKSQHSSASKHEEIHLEIHISWNTHFLGFAGPGRLFVCLFSLKAYKNQGK